MIKKKLYIALYLLILIAVPFADFTFVVIPDTQKLSSDEEFGGNDVLFERMKDIARWIVAHRDSLNIVFVASLGDMTEDGDVAIQWERNVETWQMLFDAGIPFTPCQGNHDAVSAINKYYPVSYFDTLPYWGGSMDGGIENAWYLFEEEGMEFILVIKEENNTSATEDWANSVFEQYPDRRGMFITHTHMTDGIGATRNVDNIVSKHDNVFFANMGHQCETDGEEYWTSTSPSGYTQHIFRTDYQCRGEPYISGPVAAMFRYYTFRTGDDQIDARTFDVITQSYETDESSQFSFDYEMDPLYSLILGDGTGGTITTDQDTILEFADGTEIVLTAVPDEGYEFTGWGGDLSGTDNPLTVTVTADMNITAGFTAVVSKQRMREQLNALPIMLSESFDLDVPEGAERITVMDITGSVRYSRTLQEGITRVRLVDLEQGRYIIQLSTSEGVINKPVIRFR